MDLFRCDKYDRLGSGADGAGHYFAVAWQGTVGSIALGPWLGDAKTGLAYWQVNDPHLLPLTRVLLVCCPARAEFSNTLGTLFCDV
eukprot:634240-Amorphochlora_amoeboformis.AAC.1